MTNTFNNTKKRILLVDDESSIRRTLSLGLSQQGYDVEPCENGINALKKLEIYSKNNVKFDKIILDVKLPDINGIKLGKIIKAKYPESSIVFISGYVDSINMQEIESINSSAFLGKPFSTNDLTYTIDELSKAESTSTKVAPQSSNETTASVSAYALLKLDEKVDFFETYRKLYYTNDILYCDAIKGDYDICLLIQSSSKNKCKKIIENIKQEVKGIKKADLLNIEIPLLDSNLMNVINSVEEYNDKNMIVENNRDLSKSISSYIMIEAEREKMDIIYPTLRLDEQVVYCDYAIGKYNIVLLVQGHQFSDIDKFIENKISNLDGILKVKEYPIINLFDM